MSPPPRKRVRSSIEAEVQEALTPNMKVLAKRIGRNHELAAALWDTGWYEARLLATLIDEPAKVTPAQMDRWCRDFDNWAICDTACFALFDRTPHAWAKVAQWSGKRDEFGKRAAFALLWGLTVHEKKTGDEAFLRSLLLIERAAADDRSFVKKAVNMALRATGKRNSALNTAAVATARRLADSPEASARWVGKDALRELTGASVIRRLGARAGPSLALNGALSYVPVTPSIVFVLHQERPHASAWNHFGAAAHRGQRSLSAVRRNL